MEASHWLFGEKITLDFGGGTPVRVNGSAMSAPEGSASISDKEGNLLFYTNGLTIWNRAHQIMDNGEALLGNTSSTQSALIVPHPGKDSLYFVFVVDNHAGNNGITYSIININANNGLGKVVSKNLTLTKNTAEKITAVHQCNNKDVWLLVRLWNSSSYFTFQIDKSGINLDPIISVSPFALGGQIWGTLGSLKISPNATTIAAAHSWGSNFVEIGDLNRIDGQITNFRKLTVEPPGFNGFETGPYGVEFSPDSKLLYVFCSYGNSTSQIYQFDLTLGSLLAIQQSKQLIAQLPFPYAGSLQLATDRKIYATNSFDSTLSVIDQPNIPGVGCKFISGAVRLGGQCTLGLPNFVQSFIDPDFGAQDFSATGCESRQLNFSFASLKGINAVKWDFGDPASGANNISSVLSPTHAYSGTGFFTVTAIVFRSCSVDTVRKKVYSGTLNLNLPDRSQGCIGDSLLLAVPAAEGVNYRWNTGARTAQIKTTDQGVYKITATAGCKFVDSTLVSFDRKPQFDLGEDKTICTGDLVVVDASAGPGKAYTWNNGLQSPVISLTEVGTYWVKVTDQASGCSAVDTIIVKDKPFPALNLGSDTVLCETETLLLDTRIKGIDIRFSWQDGSTEPFKKVSKAGTFSVLVTNGCTVKKDSIEVNFKTCPIGVPNAFTPNGDGRNDRFRVKYGEGVSQYHLRVFNRFGQLVFETKEQTTGWDGRMGGKQQPGGTYVWVATYFNLVSGKPVILRGTVQLLR